MIRSVRSRIFAGYAVILALVLVISLLSVGNLSMLGHAADGILRENYRSILAAENMVESLERQDSAVLMYLLGWEQQAIEQFSENEATFNQWFARARDNVTIDGEASVLDEIEQAYRQFVLAFRELSRLDREVVADDPRALHRETLFPAFSAVREPTSRLRSLNQETMNVASAQAAVIARRTIVVTLIVAGVLIAFGIAFSVVLSLLLTRPVEKLRAAFDRVAEGDYAVTLRPRGKNEFASLFENFNTMVGRLESYRAIDIGRIVTEKRRSEAIVTAIDDGIIVVDTNYRVTDANPAAQEIFGPYAGGESAHHILEYTNNRRLFDDIRAAVESQNSRSEEDDEAMIVVATGEEERRFRYSVTPATDDAGSVFGLVVVLRDYTKITEVDRLKSEFVATASHELKTPVTSIKISLDLMSETLDSETETATESWDELRELLGTATEEVLRMEQLIRDLLDLSRMESGKVEIEQQAIDAGVLVQKAIETLDAQAQEKGVTLRASDSDAQSVYTDPTKALWVLTNLVSNAVRYIDADGVIEVSCRSAGQFVVFAVQDNGPGIPYEQQGRIFDKFVRLDSESTSGTGLGLAICKELVRALGGSIWVDSSPGLGSTFQFTLPAAKAE